ncbi:hypothetical protein RSUY_38010 (plasmid) [Ralstonia solanacearum]|nr:hypothetical protein RSUY_38010 [Ralstonia solanacearum]
MGLAHDRAQEPERKPGLPRVMRVFDSMNRPLKITAGSTQ